MAPSVIIYSNCTAISQLWHYSILPIIYEIARIQSPAIHFGAAMLEQW